MTKVVVTAVTSIVTVALYTGAAFWSVCIDEIVEIFHVPNVVAQLGECSRGVESGAKIVNKGLRCM